MSVSTPNLDKTQISLGAHANAYERIGKVGIGWDEAEKYGLKQGWLTLTLIQAASNSPTARLALFSSHVAFISHFFLSPHVSPAL